MAGSSKASYQAAYILFWQSDLETMFEPDAHISAIKFIPPAFGIVHGEVLV